LRHLLERRLAIGQHGRAEGVHACLGRLKILLWNNDMPYQREHQR